jgi:AcrR family transcriptional regulator
MKARSVQKKSMSAPVVNDPRALRSRQALHGALLKLLAVKPLDQITVREITAKAGVGYATFFRHHPTKESLLDDVAAQQIRCLFNLSLPVMDAHDLRAGSIALFSYVNEHHALWSTLLTGGAAGAIREEFLRQAREVAVSRAPSGDWLPSEVGVLLIVSGTIELLAWWLRQTDPLSIERIAEIHARIVVSPVIEVSDAKRRRQSK